MAERRLRFTTQDSSGAECHGEILLAAAWHSDIVTDPHAAFTIVLARQPLQATPDSVPDGVAVCAPTSPVKLPASVREPRAPYGAGTEEEELRLPRSVITSYAGGTIWAADELPVTAVDVFLSGTTAPRLDALASALIDESRRTERYWRALAEALSRPQAAPLRVDVEKVRDQLRELTKDVSRHEYGSEAIARLQRVADGVSPKQPYADTRSLSDDVSRLRALRELPAQAERLATIRGYLAGVRLVESSSLAEDFPYTKEQLSFAALLDTPHMIDSMLALFETFRSRYVREYVTKHDRHWQAMAGLQQTLTAAEPTARAVGHLNSLKRLGRPVGLVALRDYERLRSEPLACPQPDVEASLREQPLCPACSVSLTNDAPTETLAKIIQDLERALAAQQARLASEAVRRILARGGERLEQFLQIVQASDLAGLVTVLDDDLVSFLDDLLAEPTTTTAE